jgi:hypothetical protein
MSAKNYKPVLAITRAEPGVCPACDRYGREVDAKFRELLAKDSRIDVIDLTINESGIYHTKNKSIKVHPEMKIWVTWWPSFIIFTANSWHNHKNKLQGAIFGGMINGKTGSPEEIPDDYQPTSVRNLMEWVENTLNSRLFAYQRSTLRTYDEYERACDPRLGWCMNGKRRIVNN